MNKKSKLLLVALSVAAVLCIGSSQGFTCITGACAESQKNWQAAPEYSSTWKGKMRLVGYLGNSGLYK